MARVLPTAPPAVTVELLELARLWPDTAIDLLVNPGHDSGVHIAGPDVAALLDWYEELLDREDDD